METKIIQADNTSFIYEAIISKNELQEQYSTELEKLRLQADIKGFRKGKVPVAMVEKMYGNDLLHDIAVAKLQDAFEEYLTNENIRPAGRPVLQDYKLENDVVTARIECQHFPKFDLIDFKELVVDEPSFVVEDEDIDNNIKYLECILGEKVEAEKIENELHEINITVRPGNEDSEEFNDSKPSVLRLYDNSIDPSFLEACIGKSKGDLFKYEHPMSIEQNNNEFMNVTVFDVWKVTPKELDEETISKISDERFSNIDDLKEDIGLILQDYLNSKQEKARLNQVREKVLSSYTDIKLPQVIYEDSYANTYEKYKEKYSSLEEMKKDENFINLINKQMDSIIVWNMIAQKIIEKYDMKVEVEDIEELFTKYNLPSELATPEMFEKIDKEGQASEEILTNKVLEFLSSEVSINTIDADPKMKKAILSEIKYSSKYLNDFYKSLKDNQDFVDEDGEEYDDEEHICDDDCNH